MRMPLFIVPCSGCTDVQDAQPSISVWTLNPIRVLADENGIAEGNAFGLRVFLLANRVSPSPNGLQANNTVS